MYEVYCMNLKTGARFCREFDSPYKMQLFLNKAKHSHKIMVLSHTYVND